jgi:hypothetical protein
MVRVHGRRSDHLRHGQSRPGNHAGRSRAPCGDDAIIATGRSDYPNQVNNVLGFPYIFRGALDVRATTINEEMKIAAAKALAPNWRARTCRTRSHAAYGGAAAALRAATTSSPTPFDPRLISRLPPAVAKAAMDSGVARKPIADLRRLRAANCRRGSIRPPTRWRRISERVRAPSASRVVFAEGEEEKIVRAAVQLPQRRLRHAGADRARGPGPRDRWPRSASAWARASRSTTPGSRTDNRKYAEFLYEPAAAQRAI